MSMRGCDHGDRDKYGRKPVMTEKLHEHTQLEECLENAAYFPLSS
jgi:hypothetical protein